MAISFQAIDLDAREDKEGMLVFRDGRLSAVIARLSAMHGDLAGHWYLESGLGEVEISGQRLFTTLAEVETMLTGSHSAG